MSLIEVWWVRCILITAYWKLALSISDGCPAVFDDIVSGTKKTDAAIGGASKQEVPAAQTPGPGGDEWVLRCVDR